MTLNGHGHGKVILLGEHAAVYGVHALVASLSLDVRIEARPADGPETRLRVTHRANSHDDSPYSTTCYVPGDESLTGRALSALLEALPTLPALDLEAFSTVPAGVGLGGSAALSVALARVLSAAAGLALDSRALHELAAVAETVFHGRPSGVDVAAAALEPPGVLAYRRGDPIERIALGAELHLVVGVVEPAPPTHETVAAVARYAASGGADWEAWLRELAELVAHARAALERGDWEALGRAFDVNHALLARLGLSTAALDRACERARAAGALGAKLTGKGGGGAVLALATGARAGGAIAAALSEGGAHHVHVVRHPRAAGGAA